MALLAIERTNGVFLLTQTNATLDIKSFAYIFNLTISTFSPLNQ